tara:strand:- start:117 stop:638 length:522 start_codon:yes stop_codon:yes gene_type:complete
MARITVEDCLDKVDSPYDLVLVAKERAAQLNSGDKPNVDPEDDKNTVIALKEIAEDKVKVKDLKESAINKLRKHVEQDSTTTELDDIEGDDFENLYKGEVSKSGTPILPSKRARKIPEKIEVFKTEKVSEEPFEDNNLSEENEVSLEELQDQEKKEEEKNESDNPNISDDNNS